jgi:hypothetical protein
VRARTVLKAPVGFSGEGEYVAVVLRKGELTARRLVEERQRA